MIEHLVLQVNICSAWIFFTKMGQRKKFISMKNMEKYKQS
jgi:hypothetical protein